MINLSKIKNDLNEFYADSLAIIRDNVKWVKDDEGIFTLKKISEPILGLDFAYGDVGDYLTKAFKEELNVLKSTNDEYRYKYNELVDFIINKVKESGITDIREILDDANDNIDNRAIMAGAIKYFNPDLIFDLERLSPSSEINALIMSMRINTDSQYYEPLLIIALTAMYNDKVVDALKNNRKQ